MFSRSLVPCMLGVLLLLGSATAAETRLNVAKYQPCAASSETTADPALFATDGIVGNENRWKSNAAAPQTLTITLSATVTLGSAHLYLGRDDIEPVTNFSLQYWTGSAWATIPGTTVSGNAVNEHNLVFTTPVTTSKVRFTSTDAVVRVREIALFPPNGPAGFPIGTDVIVNAAKNRPATASSVDTDNYAINAFDGYADDTARWKSVSGSGPHTLDVDLEVTTRVGSVHLYSASASTPTPIANFTVQYWTGSAWADIPGGTLTGNTEIARRVLFPAPVETTKIRLKIPDTGTHRVREFLVFPANNSGGYPLGTNAVVGPPPTTKFNTYGDGFWKIVNRVKTNSLMVSATGATQTLPDATEEEKHFQLLYNLESDTFRIRNRDSWLCIAAKNAATAAGTAVVEVPDYQGEPWELWRLEEVETGWYRLINVWSGLALETDGLDPATVTLQTPAANQKQHWELNYITHYPKKGNGGYESEWSKWGANWNYNWGRDTGTSLPGKVTFTPMQWGPNWPSIGALPTVYSAWHTTSKAIYHLGFNEPDHTDQANLSVDSAISLWPQLMRSDVPLVSPVPASAFGGWLGDFYTKAKARGYRVDYTAVHWYGSPNADSLITHLNSVNDTWGKPVWLTEFSTVDWGGTASWTEEDNWKFLAEFLWKAEDHVWLKRYGLFIFTGTPRTDQWDKGGGGQRSDARKSDGSPTPFGELYASWDGDRSFDPMIPYLVHNHAAVHRLRASSTTNSLSNGDLRRSDVSAQFMFVPTGASGRYWIVSLRDGRRLRYNGTALDFSPPGTTGTTVEWTQTADWAGTYFIGHPSSGKRLRMNRTNDSSGAPTALTYDMASGTTATDSTRWRLVKPYAPVETDAPNPPASLTATAGADRITLTWPASTATDVLRYTVWRRTSPTATWTPLTTATSPGYVDTAVVTGITFRYAVTVTDWTEQDSANSPEATATIAPASSYTAWAATAFAGWTGGKTTFAEDADGDGLANGLEYATGGNPTAPSASPLAAANTPAGLTLTYTRRTDAPDVTLDVLASPSLLSTSWTSVPTETVSQTVEGPLTRVVVRPMVPAAASQWFRLRVTQQP